MPEPLKPAEIVSRYRFVLSAFGLQYVRTQAYQPGKELKPAETESSFTTTGNDKGEPNMHSGFSRTEGISAIKTGLQPISDLGTPVFSDVLLHKQDQQEFEGVQLVNCLVEVEQSKNIIRTTVQGRNGTVKEYISDGDYIINLKGAITRTFKSNYPKEEMIQFLELLKQNKSLKVLSEYLLMFGVYEVVVDRYKMGQESGSQNMQKFEINCSSDVPLLLKKKNVQG